MISTSDLRTATRVLAFALITLSNCAFGSNGNSQEESLTSLSLILANLTASAPLKLRFYDRESNATISTFTNGANTIVLQSPGEIEIEKLEIWTEPNLLAGVFPWKRLMPVSELEAHSTDVAGSSSSAKTAFYQNAVLRDFFLTPNGTDSANRSYYGLSTLTATAIPPGSISRVVLHVKRLVLNGTFNGTPFSVLVSTATDPAYTPTCTTTASLRGTGQIIPIFNYQLLFSGATSANSTHLESIIKGNLQSTSGVLSEHFVLSCVNLQ
ncbi:MAG: hypothetical protein K8S54_12305 [Spirochaetia bacterium]|nr:hypothetical protein [Spirochaetia bacterium]